MTYYYNNYYVYNYYAMNIIFFAPGRVRAKKIFALLNTFHEVKP